LKNQEKFEIFYLIIYRDRVFACAREAQGCYQEARGRLPHIFFQALFAGANRRNRDFWAGRGRANNVQKVFLYLAPSVLSHAVITIAENHLPRGEIPCPR
jgi:hypothetical protein